MKAKQEGTSVQAVLAAFLHRWLEGEVAAQAAEKEAEKGEVSEWHTKLDIVLEQGDPDDLIGIQRNLDWAVAAIRSRSKPGSHRKAG